MTHKSDLLAKIEGREAVIAVIGLGYVGLPIAISFAEAGFTAIGVDLDPERVAAVSAGRSFLTDLSDERVGALSGTGRLRATTSTADLKEADAVLICVPTPITDGIPDLSYVVSGGEAVGEILRPGMLVILESTTYPGTTEELLRPLLEADGLKAGKDFFLAYSPERIDPGNPSYEFSDIPKVVGAIDEGSLAVASTLYEQVVPKVFQVSSTREAELAKLIENTFRHVNIALVNELAVYAHELGIDIWESIEAAATKPFGFMPFYPGPGWGGHCIPLDPAYLSWRVRRDRAHEVRFVEVAQAVSYEMPQYVARRVSLLLNDEGKAVRGSKILGIGVSYKPGVTDTREAGALKVLSRLREQGATVSYHDPLVSEVRIGDDTQSSVELSPEVVADHDVIVILVAQQGVDWGALADPAPVVLDCCNALHRKGPRVKRL